MKDLERFQNFDFAYLPEKKWLIEDWLPENSLSMLTGSPAGCGKSILALQIAVAICSGGDFPALASRFDPPHGPFPWKIKGPPRPVLFLSWDDQYEEAIRRLNAFGARQDHLAGNFKYKHQLEPLWVSEQYGGVIGEPWTDEAKVFFDFVGESETALVILDALASCYCGPSYGPDAIAFAHQIAGKFHGAAVLIITHPGNNGKAYFGGKAWFTSPKSFLQLKVGKETGEITKAKIKQLKNGYGPIQPSIEVMREGLSPWRTIAT